MSRGKDIFGAIDTRKALIGDSDVTAWLQPFITAELRVFLPGLFTA